MRIERQVSAGQSWRCTESAFDASSGSGAGTPADDSGAAIDRYSMQRFEADGGGQHAPTSLHGENEERSATRIREPSSYAGINTPQMPNLKITRATESEVPIILNLIRALAEYEQLSHEVVATESKLRETLFGARPAAEVLLAYWDDACVGFALYFFAYSTFLAAPGIYLEDFFVRPEMRRQGIGLALFRRLAENARETGCGRIEWSVLEWNQTAIDFYRKLGAGPVSGWSRYRLAGDALDNLMPIHYPNA